MTTDTILVMTLLFFPVFICLAAHLRFFFKKIVVFDKKVLLCLFFIFLAGFYMRNSEYRYGIDVDGIYYQEMAKSIYFNNLFSQGCALSTPLQCDYFYGSVVLPGYPFLINTLFYLFGPHDILAMMISGFLSSFTIILVFLIYYLLFRCSKGALIASAIFTFCPLDLFCAGTAAVRPTAIFFMCLTVVFFLLSLKERKISFFITMALLFSYTIYVRLEFYILVFPMIASLFYNKEKVDKKILFYFFIAAYIFFIHQLFVFDWLKHNHFGLTGGKQSTFSLQYFSTSKKIISYFFIGSSDKIGFLFNPYISFFFFLSIFFFLSHKKHRKPLSFCIFLFLVFFTGVTFFFAARGKEIIRYLHPICVPYSLLAGFSIKLIMNKISKKSFFISVFIIILILFTGKYFKLKIFADGRKNEPYVAKYCEIIKKLPENVLVFTVQPQIFNFDFLKGKNLSIASYGQNQLEEYQFFLESFVNFIEKHQNLRWFLIPIEHEKNVFCKAALESNAEQICDSEHCLELFEIKNKKNLIKKMKEVKKKMEDESLSTSFNGRKKN